MFKTQYIVNPPPHARRGGFYQPSMFKTQYIVNPSPMLSASDFKNAWAYAESFPDEIEAVIKLNDID